MKTVLVAFLLTLSAFHASADDLYDACMDAADGTNPGFAQCGSDWVKRADAKLNEVWKERFPEFEEASKKDLLAEQRLWNAYKEQSCNFYSNGDFGREGQVIHFFACRAKVIEQRIGDLQTYGSEGE